MQHINEPDPSRETVPWSKSKSRLSPRPYLADVPAAEPASAARIREIFLLRFARKLVVAFRYVAASWSQSKTG